MSEDKELIWVSKEFSERYKKIEDDNRKIEALEEYLESVTRQTRDEYKSCLETMEEDAVMYQGLFLKTKKRFGELKDEALGSFYEMWENFDKEKSAMVKKIESINEALTPLKEQVNSINKTLGQIRTYDFEKLIETLAQINGLCEKEKNMFEFLCKNYIAKESHGT